MPTAISPKMGVEIEFLGASARDAVAALIDAGLACADEGYNHRTRDYWKIVPDSSCGLELVSPPLEWHQRLDIRKAMGALTSVGAAVNKDCGFHVHHEWPWRDHLPQSDKDSRLLGVRRLYRACEPLLRTMLSPSRWEDNTFCQFASQPPQASRPTDEDIWCPSCDSYNCGYCLACDGHEVCDHVDPDGDGRTTNVAGPGLARLDLPEDLYSLRYVAVNFVSLDRQPTIEFRQHQGTLNSTKALAWLEFTRALTHAASRPGLEAHERFAFVFDKLSTSTRTYLRQRAEEAGEDLDALVDQSLNDYLAAS